MISYMHSYTMQKLIPQLNDLILVSDKSFMAVLRSSLYCLNDQSCFTGDHHNRLILNLFAGQTREQHQSNGKFDSDSALHA